MRTMLIALTAAALALAACQQKPAEATDPRDGKVAAAPPATDAPAAPLTAAEAFRMAFGKPAPAVRTVTDAQSGSDNVYTYAPGKLVALGEGATALVSLATNASDCHACSGAMAIHYFKREGGAWKLTGSWPEIVPGNGFGAPPDWTTRTDLGVPLYLVTEAGWTGQGYTCSSVDMIELTPAGPEVRGENLPTHYDNEGVGTPPVVSIDGKLERGPDGKLRVTFTGTRSGFTDYETVGGKLTRVSANVIDDC